MTSHYPRAEAVMTGPAQSFEDLRDVIDTVLAEPGEFTVDLALERIAGLARSILGCRYAAIVIRDAEAGINRFIPAEADDVGGTDAAGLDTIDGLVARVVFDGVTIRTPDIALESYRLGLPVDGAALRELLAVPIRSSGKVSGGLFAGAREDGRPFRREAETAARTIATAIGFLVDHARMVNSVSRRERWLRASTDLTRELVADVHANSMQAVVERLLSVADVDLASVVIPSTDQKQMIITSLAGAKADLIEERVLERDGTVHDHLFHDHEPLIVNLSRAGAYRDLIDELDIETALLVPMPDLPGEGGILALYRESGRPPFSQAEVDMADTFATQIVLAMELARARADRERGALIAERDRIARDLHDNIIQSLFATGMALQSTAADLEPGVADRVHRAIDELDQTILQIRTTIYRLSTPTLDDGSGLRQRLERVIERLEEMLGFAVDVDFSGPIDFGVSDEVGYDIVAVAQETLTNVAKHAHATSVRVSLTLRDGVVTLVVADNGRGIGDSSRRSGLANLRSRAEAHGGSMSTESGSDGTRITWQAPAAS